MLILYPFFLAIAYRIKGGGWFTFNNDTICRIIWAICFSIACYAQTTQLYYVPYTIVFGFVMNLIPYKEWMNMGTWPTAQKSWPGFFLPTYTQAEWTGLPMFERTANDFFGMMAVGFLHGLIVFGGYSYFNIEKAVLACAIVTFGEPFSYLLGRYIPITITSSLKAYELTWCEFLIGFVYGIAVCVL